MTEMRNYPSGAPCWVDLGTTDLTAAQEFYTRLLGWSYVDTGEEGGHYQLAMLKDRPIAGMMAMSPEMLETAVPPSWTTYFASDNADDVGKWVTEHDGAVLMGPMDVMTQGRMLVGRDPAGAVFGVWQPRDMPGSGLLGEPGSVAWTELLSRDPQATGEFYAAVFGFDRETQDIGMTEPYTVFSIGETQVAGMMQMPTDVPPEAPSYWMTYFAVTDADAAVATVREMDGTVLAEPRDTEYGRWAMIADPQGAVLSVLALPAS
ncbi:MAG TPA: VOC family protein [Actinomycetes bacterium]|nr:VOC family protein [Actinomycetes bacterium]